MNYSIDNLDKRIIYHLQKNARETSAPQIAEEMKVSSSTVRKRIDKLEENNIIKGYHADIDFGKCEKRLTYLFTCNVSVTERETLARQILKIPGVINVKEIMAGKENLVVKAIADDPNDISRISRKLTNIGLEIERENLVQNEYHHPYHPFGPPEQHEYGENETPVPETQELTSIKVTEKAPITNKTLQQANKEGLIPENVLVVAIKRNGDTITPKGSTEIQTGDIVKIFTPNRTDINITEAFTGEPEPVKN